MKKSINLFGASLFSLMFFLSGCQNIENKDFSSRHNQNNQIVNSQNIKIKNQRKEKGNLASILIKENPGDITEKINKTLSKKYGCYLFGIQLDKINEKIRNDPRYNTEDFIFSFVVPDNFLVDEMDIYMKIIKDEFKLKVYQKYKSNNILLLEDYVGIGMHEKGRFSTFSGTYYLQRVVNKPYWYPPEWANQKKPSYPGENNPFGLWMSELSRLPSQGDYNWRVKRDSGMRIHSTNNPLSIGKKSSHGCIRMNPKTAEELFKGILYNTYSKPEKANSRGTIHPLKKPIKIEILDSS
ncbi:MAG: L,D-transpeptidase [Minisyncoccales bacterium]